MGDDFDVTTTQAVNGNDYPAQTHAEALARLAAAEAEQDTADRAAQEEKGFFARLVERLQEALISREHREAIERHAETSVNAGFAALDALNAEREAAGLAELGEKEARAIVRSGANFTEVFGMDGLERAVAAARDAMHDDIAAARQEGQGIAPSDTPDAPDNVIDLKSRRERD